VPAGRRARSETLAQNVLGRFNRNAESSADPFFATSENLRAAQTEYEDSLGSTATRLHASGRNRFE
jgi:hypothetical protein